MIHRVKVKALGKAKILKGAEVEIIPFTNRKQRKINDITFLPIAELSSSLDTPHSRRHIGERGG